MPLKPKNANQIPEKRNVTFDDTSFFKGLLTDEYILVVGSGVILSRLIFPETRGDINALLLNAINEDKSANFESLSDAVSAFPLEISPLYSLLIDGIDYNIDDIAPELQNLLKTRYFRYVFTTTPDHYLEVLLSAIWENELRVVNFSDENSMRKFYDAIRNSKGNYNQPTLFYVFGKAVAGQTNPTKFLETDKDAINYIENWIKIDKDCPLVSFLKKKRIFSIGCDFDDWYHRFFWHILTVNFAREDSSYNDNAVLGNKTGKLEEYLSYNNVCVHSDPWSVLDYINHMLTSHNGEQSFIELIRSKTLEGKVFLSYKNNPDSAVALSLYNELSQRASFKLWLDSSNLLGGQTYNTRIPEAIRFSQVFIPILTSSVATVLNQYTVDELRSLEVSDGLPFFIQEWKWAIKVKGLSIIPVAFEGYDLRGPEHKKFETLMYGNDELSHPSSIDMGQTQDMSSTSLDKLVVSIRHALGIYE